MESTTKHNNNERFLVNALLRAERECADWKKDYMALLNAVATVWDLCDICKHQDGGGGCGRTGGCLFEVDEAVWGNSEEIGKE